MCEVIVLDVFGLNYLYVDANNLPDVLAQLCTVAPLEAFSPGYFSIYIHRFTKAKATRKSGSLSPPMRMDLVLYSGEHVINYS